MLKFSILNKSVKKKDPGSLNPRFHRGGSIMVKAISLRKDYQGGFLRKLRIYSPSEHKRRIFCRDKRTGKEKVFKFGKDSISHLLPPNLPRLRCYTKFVFCAIIGKTRNRINNYVQFYRQKGSKVIRR